tara:strand:+ start:262 stop:1122 length:861 start_codon:yes stop_codon:yes gene_type:complete
MPNWKKVITSGSNAILNHLTASGAISSSGIITANSFAGTIGTATQGTIDHDSLANFVANEHIDHSAVSVTAGTGLTGGGTIAANRTLNVIGGTGITANANDIAITAGGIDTTQLADDAVTSAKLAHSIAIVTNITSPTSTIGLRDLDWQGNIDGGNATYAQGDVIYHATTTATTQGNIYSMGIDGVVVPADADAVATASTILCVALGANASLGLLLRGTVVLRTSPGAQPGLPFYLSTTAGIAQAAAPSGTGDVVRVLGYQLTPNGEGDQVNVCYFNPDNTWVELT